MVGYGSFEQTVDTLEVAARSASPWLLGDRFSAADVYVGSQVDFGLAFGSIPERPAFTAWAERRSEEHTSELQSLMRISYAVFCLKKKMTTFESDHSKTSSSRHKASSSHSYTSL